VAPNPQDDAWRWTSKEQYALDELKRAISTNCMAYFNKKWETELIVDASPVGLSAVLAQVNLEDNRDRRFVCFAFRLLTDVERRYSQCEKEALGAVWGCELFWLYLKGQRFKLVTDNLAFQLIFSNSAARPPARIERWALRQTQFDYEIIHKPSEANVADYFSRQPRKGLSREGIPVIKGLFILLGNPLVYRTFMYSKTRKDKKIK
jgi:hypothetical protein